MAEYYVVRSGKYPALYITEKSTSTCPAMSGFGDAYLFSAKAAQEYIASSHKTTEYGLYAVRVYISMTATVDEASAQPSFVCESITAPAPTELPAPAPTFTDAAGKTYPLEVGRRYLVKYIPTQDKIQTKKEWEEVTRNAPIIRTAVKGDEPFIWTITEISLDRKMMNYPHVKNTSFISVQEFTQNAKRYIVFTELSPLTADELKILSLLRIGIDATEAVE